HRLPQPLTLAAHRGPSDTRFRAPGCPVIGGAFQLSAPARRHRLESGEDPEPCLGGSRTLADAAPKRRGPPNPVPWGQVHVRQTQKRAPEYLALVPAWARQDRPCEGPRDVHHRLAYRGCAGPPCGAGYPDRDVDERW